MKALLLSIRVDLILLCLAFPTSTETFQCPTQITDNTKVLYADPTDCSYYFQCDGFSSNPVRRKCPGNLLFNDAYSVCDWPQHSDCPKEKDIFTATDEDSDFLCPDYNTNPAGIYADPNDCSYFFRCNSFSRIPVHQQCPENLLFNANLSACDWPQQAFCDHRTVIQLVGAIGSFVWSDDLLNISSALSVQYSSMFCTQMSNTFTDALKGTFNSCGILEYRHGSVLANSKVKYTLSAANPITQPNTIKSKLQNSLQSRNQLNVRLSSAHGLLGSY